MIRQNAQKPLRENETRVVLLAPPYDWCKVLDHPRPTFSPGFVDLLAYKGLPDRLGCTPPDVSLTAECRNGAIYVAGQMAVCAARAWASAALSRHPRLVNIVVLVWHLHGVEVGARVLIVLLANR